MPLPLLAVAAVPAAAKIGMGIAAGVTLLIAGIVVYKICIDGVGEVEIKEGKEDDKADITVLLVGEKGAGKKTLTNVIRKGKFPTEDIKMFNAYTSLGVTSSIFNKIEDDFFFLKDKKIKIICTNGDEQHFKSVHNIIQMDHDIRCYVFDSREFDKNDDIKYGIQDMYDDCKKRKINCFAIGTWGDSVEKEKDSIIESVEKMNVRCAIFELKEEGVVKKVIKFLFDRLIDYKDKI